MEFKGLIITTLLVGLFIVAMINGSILLSHANNQNSSLMENEAINSTFGDMQSELDDVQRVSDSTKDSFEKEKVTITGGFLLLSSIINAGKVFTSVITNIYSLTFGLVADVLGINDIILGVLTGIIVISGILLTWRLYKAGE